VTPTETTHIVLDDRGIAWITGTNTKVIEVALDKIAQGWSPEEIHFQHPHLPLSKIYAALAYYYDHQAEIDAQITAQYQEVQKLRAQSQQLSRRELEERLQKVPDVTAGSRSDG
jgi:uncharacterized protein (DUF433 family)